MQTIQNWMILRENKKKTLNAVNSWEANVQGKIIYVVMMQRSV